MSSLSRDQNSLKLTRSSVFIARFGTSSRFALNADKMSALPPGGLDCIRSRYRTASGSERDQESPFQARSHRLQNHPAKALFLIPLATARGSVTLPVA